MPKATATDVLVGSLQRIRNVPGDRQRLTYLEWTHPQSIGKRAFIKGLHDERDLPGDFRTS